MKKIFVSAIKVVYWLGVAYIPIEIFRFRREYMAAIGCPASGECYVPGSEHLLHLEMLIRYAALLLFPAAAWGIFRAIRGIQ